MLNDLEYSNVREKTLSILLDSSLITGVRFVAYNYKIIRCNEYLQVYYYPNKKIKDNIKNLDIDSLHVSSSYSSSNEKNDILHRNAIRAKLNCQRLAKSNASEWKSFITLTYRENMTDISIAKHDLNFFIKNIRKKKEDFKYIAIPEFQKRGAIHFHLLTNLSTQDNYIITKQENNNKYYNVKYWNKGFTSFELLNGDIKKIVGYISKYMTKECDNRLFGYKKYSYSLNLVKPVSEYLDTSNSSHIDYFERIIKDKECIYKTNYFDNCGNEVKFFEFQVKKN